MKRKCVICDSGDDAAHIYAFDELLRDLEIGGRYAHPTCLMEKQQLRKRQILKRGKGYENASA